MSLEAITKALEEMEAREKAATPGPWMACVGSGNIECTGIHSDSADGVICDFLTDYEMQRDPKKVIIHDLKFVEAARTDLPKLVKALWVAVDALEDDGRTVALRVIASILGDQGSRGQG